MTKPSPPTYTPAPITTVTPKGISCATINQFVVIADSENPFSVRWCAIGDPTDWPTPNTDDARAKQAGSQSMPNAFGVVRAVSGGDFFGYVFQERGITKMSYVGGDIVFTFDTFEESRGCFANNRRAAVDDMVFFESSEGYHVLVDGQITDIGHGRINHTAPTALTSNDRQKTIVVNPTIGCVFFENNALCYNYKTDQWTEVDALGGRNLFSIASHTGIIGEIIVGVNWFGYQDQTGGVPQTATIETAETDLNPGGRTFVSGVRPLLNKSTATSVTVSIGERDDLSETPTYHTLSSVNSRTGRHDGRVDGRYLRTRIVITGGFDTLLGEDIDSTPSGSV